MAPLSTDLTRGEIALAIGAIAEPVWLQMKAGAPVKVIFPERRHLELSRRRRHQHHRKKSERGGAVPQLDDQQARRQRRRTRRRLSDQSGSNKPSLEGLDYPTQDQVYNLKAEEWIATRDERMKEWRATFGVK